MKRLKWRGLIVSVIGLALVHCNAGENFDITDDALAKECAGLGDEMSASEKEAYCKAETLNWTYDDENNTLTLTNSRVLVNSCSDRKIEVVEEFFGFYFIKATEAPINGFGCYCMSVYDFEITIENVLEDIIFVELTREVITNERSEETVVAQTLLDLSSYNGSMVVSTENIDPWCQ